MWLVLEQGLETAAIAGFTPADLLQLGASTSSWTQVQFW